MKDINFKHKLQQFVYHRWYISPDKPNIFLGLFSYVYQGIIWLRRYWLTRKDNDTRKFKVPVIIVGNIVVGGTGKTPMVIWLANYCQSHGIRVGVISKGYGRSSSSLQVVEADSCARQVGDEALLISLRTKVPVVVANKRLAAIKELHTRFQVQLIISDDGLQDYRLARAFEIILFDGQYRYGNGYCFPAGPLREPVSRIKQANLVLEKVANNLDLNSKQFCLEPKQLINLKTQQVQSLSFFKDKKIHAVTGIAHAELFFKSLEGLGFEVIRHQFIDHHNFIGRDFLFKDKLPIVMTEKDAVKCRELNITNTWFLSVEVIINKVIGENILRQLKLLQQEKLTKKII